MLTELRVTDLALVASAQVSFGPGLNLLTGETGSGKSLLVDALGLALGDRASAEQVRHGSDRAIVDAAFRVDAEPTLECLRDLGFEAEADLVLTREVGGSGRARVNGRPATPTQLRRLGDTLVEIHGQHDQQRLLDAEAQTLMLDELAQTVELRGRVAVAHDDLVRARRQLADLERLQARGEKELEHMRWQLSELRAANLEAGEDMALAQERSVARHAARLAELTGVAADALAEQSSLDVALTELKAALELDPSLDPIHEQLRTAADTVREAGLELRRYGEGVDLDPRRLEEIESRLAQLEAIKRKHGGDLESAIAERDRLADRLESTESLETALEASRSEVERAGGVLADLAADLSVRRQVAVTRLDERITAELAALRLEAARFAVQLVARAETGPDGAETAVMMFSANPGEPLGPLARVASGGELSRVMLAIKAAALEAAGPPTLIFDEVDSGIGGETAIQVGVRLRALGRTHQVLVVTHLPQIACFADRHLAVSKAVGGDGRNVVVVEELESAEARARELARMMSGGVTEKALARAHELLDEARARAS